MKQDRLSVLLSAAYYMILLVWNERVNRAFLFTFVRRLHIFAAKRRSQDDVGDIQSNISAREGEEVLALFRAIWEKVLFSTPGKKGRNSRLRRRSRDCKKKKLWRNEEGNIFLKAFIVVAKSFKAFILKKPQSVGGFQNEPGDKKKPKNRWNKFKLMKL